MDNQVDAKTAAHARQREVAIHYAVRHLLNRLMVFVAVRPKHPEDNTPEHDMVWMTGIGHSPEETVERALKEFPALLFGTLPAGVSLVQTKMLDDMVGVARSQILQGYGDDLVLQRAAELQNETSEEKRRSI